ncbi:hypothetical protein CMO93_00810 [Candidatus Woesearchaeota archaeon]|nr:hypothetical protein [Candidatus Woesearchaeota archaeon]
MRKAQGGLNAAILVAIIGGLIILYILFLPEAEREALLEGEEVKKTGTTGEEEEDVFLRVFPGRLDIIEEIEDKQVPNVFLFETTNAKELEKINPFIVRRGWFDTKSKITEFKIDNLENTDNVILSFKAKKHEGILVVKLNNEVVFENDIESETTEPIKLKKDLLNHENVLEFSVSSVGVKFWKTNEYSFENVRIIGDITDKSKQESRNVFILTGTELFNIEEANLRFVPYCANAASVGVLDISINNRNVFSAVPVCEDSYKQAIPLGILNSGENRIILKTNKGSYSVEQIRIDFDEKDIKTNVYFFEVNQSQIDEIEDRDKDAFLTIEFVDDRKNKRADLNINDRLSSIDDDERIFTKNLNDFLEKGNNFIELRPRTKLDVVELKVEFKER